VPGSILLNGMGRPRAASHCGQSSDSGGATSGTSPTKSLWTTVNLHQTPHGQDSSRTSGGLRRARNLLRKRKGSCTWREMISPQRVALLASVTPQGRQHTRGR